MSTDLHVTLLQQVKQGDNNAFNQLYKAYKLDAFKFAMHMLRDTEEAENMVHDLFTKIWHNKNRIKPEQNFRSFLFTCLRNLVLDHIKREKRNRIAFQSYINESCQKEDPIGVRERRYRMIQTAMNALSDKRREIIYMCFVDGKSYQEIADSYSISKNTVKNQLVKAKQLLRDQLKPKMLIA
ncbi:MULTISPECIES: RNA polymerase sigma factor [Olivibacter]|jgi:RNA polymerase sigma-70 factor (ECF subfamily)|uniref:RNA polymerase sigma factor n=1 Tax=Olivibacter oleidegradans TaxID=760123 RepID=A0ABV6HGK3_9SPHI|nr:MULTISPECIES: RNA polymerase sigma-70 factor [Olivibacter]QEL00461.1 RNA polymerase sigma-70 factor [Olivibacter sp. LS-1]